MAVLLVGWGLGWLVARSVVGATGRGMLVAWRDAIEAEWRPVADAGRPVPWRAIGTAALSSFLAGVTHCAACSGFWIGCGIGFRWPIAGTGLVGALATGAAVMGANALLDGILSAAGAIERAMHAWADRQERPPSGVGEVPPTTMPPVDFPPAVNAADFGARSF